MTEQHLLAKVGQYALIRNDLDQILILQRASSNKWSLPGGRLNIEDTWLEGLNREIKEETNLVCDSFKPFAVNLIKSPHQVKYCVYFLTKNNGDKIKIGFEHCLYKWVGKGDVDLLEMEYEEVTDVVRKYFENV